MISIVFVNAIYEEDNLQSWQQTINQVQKRSFEFTVRNSTLNSRRQYGAFQNEVVVKFWEYPWDEIRMGEKHLRVRISEGPFGIFGASFQYSKRKMKLLSVLDLRPKKSMHPSFHDDCLYIFLMSIFQIRLFH